MSSSTAPSSSRNSVGFRVSCVCVREFEGMLVRADYIYIYYIYIYMLTIFMERGEHGTRMLGFVCAKATGR